MRRNLVLLWLLLSLLSLTACEVAPSRRPVSQTKETSLFRITLWSERKHYTLDEAAHLRLTIENITNEVVILQDPLSPVVDILVYPIYANDALHWSDGAGSQHNLSELTLHPGEQYIIEWTVPPLQEGEHSAYGVWANSGDIKVVVPICYGGAVCP